MCLNRSAALLRDHTFLDRNKHVLSVLASFFNTKTCAHLNPSACHQSTTWKWFTCKKWELFPFLLSFKCRVKSKSIKQLPKLSRCFGLSLPWRCPPFPVHLKRPHCRIFSRVSGSLRATRPPHTSAAKDSRMGTALVTPTKLLKIELPSTAASLHRAFSTPNAVALRDTETRHGL